MFQTEGMADCKDSEAGVDSTRERVQWNSVAGTHRVGGWGMLGDEIRQIIRDQIRPGLVNYGRNLVFISRIMGSNWRILSWGMKVAGR